MRRCGVHLGLIIMAVIAFALLASDQAAFAEEGSSRGMASVVMPVTLDFAVVDPEGKPVRGALVEVLSQHGLVFRATTGENGSIPRQNLWGFTDYTLVVTAAGFIPYDMSFRLAESASWRVALMILSFNIPLLLLHVTTLIITTLFWLPAALRREEGPNPWLGCIAATAWFVTALVTLMDDISWLPHAILYSAIGVICIIQAIGGILAFVQEMVESR